MNPPLAFIRHWAWLAPLFILCVTGQAAEPAAAGEAIDWRAVLAPFHTVTLHLPIGFVAIAVLLEVYSWFRNSPQLRDAIGLILWASAASAILVSLLGWFRGSDGGYDPLALERHRWYGVGVSGVTTLMALIHFVAYRKEKRNLVLATGYRLILAINLALLGLAGHLGGNLTHGSKYLFEDAPPWVGEWVEKLDDHVIELEAKVVDLDLPETTSGGGTDAAAGSGVYADVLRPAFEKKCYQCHGEEKQKGDYRMDTVEALFKTGESELDPIVKKRPLESYLVEVISLPEHDDYVMPPEGKEAFTPEETLALIHWIWDGAEIGDEPKSEPEAQPEAPEPTAVEPETTEPKAAEPATTAAETSQETE